MRNVIYVGTRNSPLAVKQTSDVVAELKKNYPELTFKLVEVDTKGDRNKQIALSQLGKAGIFTDELGQSILAGQIDCAVHSLKDMPISLTDGLTLAKHPKRENPFDSLIMRDVTKIEELPVKALLGTSSLRREVELLRLRSDLIPVPIRGNIGNRLKQLAEGDFSAIILANAGLNRLDWQNNEKFGRISFDHWSFLPSVGQGILALECRQGDKFILERLNSIADEATTRCAAAERSFLIEMGETSSAQAIAAYASITATQLINLTVMISQKDGQQMYLRETFSGNDGQQLGQLAAEEMKKRR